MTDTKISPEVIAALRVLREQDRGPEFRDAMSVLDNAGIFAAIDAAAECTCPSGYDFINGGVGQCTCPKVYTTAQR